MGRYGRTIHTSLGIRIKWEYKQFKTKLNKNPHAHRRGGSNILHQLSLSISPCTEGTISQSKLSSLILPTNASAIAFGPMSRFTIRTPPFHIRIATNLLTYAFILILLFFTFVLNVQIFCKQKACNGFSRHCRPFALIFIIKGEVGNELRNQFFT